jgi:hypothetical protein
MVYHDHYQRGQPLVPISSLEAPQPVAQQINSKHADPAEPPIVITALARNLSVGRGTKAWKHHGVISPTATAKFTGPGGSTASALRAAAYTLPQPR